MTAWDAARAPKIATIEGDEPGARLARIWRTEPGAIGWLSSVDHKEIGKRYIVTALVFLLLGGLEALVMRMQLAGPNRRLLTPEQYDQLFTMHGVTMIFLYAGPVLSGFSNFLWPLLLGSRDMAFPRLNALSYWVYIAAGLFMYAGFLAGHGPNAGWFNYVPLAAKAYDPGVNIDVYSLGLILLGISTSVGAANFIVSFLRTRAPGMSINRVPILTWGTLTASVANLLAIPSVSLAFFLLWMDRQFGTHFFTTAEGQPLLWQHLFWMFGHPWVYAHRPAGDGNGVGRFADLLPPPPGRLYAGRPLDGGDHGAGLRGLGPPHVRHRAAEPGAVLLQRRFADHHRTQRRRRVRLDRDDLDGTAGHPNRLPVLRQHDRPVRDRRVSGVMTALRAVDWQLTDTYFVVAHIHYVLIGINVFPVVGGLYYWFPR